MSEKVVHLVDDDEAVRRSAGFMLKTSGFAVKSYASGVELLKEKELAPGCILLDVRMPDMDGLELQEELVKRGSTLPVIIMTGHGDVPLAVRAMKAGAVDFIEKPFTRAQLVAGLDKAFRKLDAASDANAKIDEARARISELTEREREVFELLVAGHQNKVIGHKLGISPRTIQVHRGRIMHKLNVTNLQDLVRLAIASKPK